MCLNIEVRLLANFKNSLYKTMCKNPRVSQRKYLILLPSLLQPPSARSFSVVIEEAAQSVHRAAYRLLRERIRILGLWPVRLLEAVQ